MFEFEHGIRMIILRAGDERQTKVCFRRPGIHVRRLRQKARRVTIAIEVVQGDSQIVKHLIVARYQFVYPRKKPGGAFVLFTLGQNRGQGKERLPVRARLTFDEIGYAVGLLCAVGTISYIEKSERQLRVVWLSFASASEVFGGFGKVSRIRIKRPQ